MVWVPRETKVLVLRDPESVDLDRTEDVNPRKWFARAMWTQFSLYLVQRKLNTTQWITQSCTMITAPEPFAHPFGEARALREELRCFLK